MKFPINIKKYTFSVDDFATDAPEIIKHFQSILIIGPRKVGKKLSTETAADAAGLHLVQVDCIGLEEAEKVHSC